MALVWFMTDFSVITITDSIRYFISIFHCVFPEKYPNFAASSSCDKDDILKKRH